MQMADVRPVCPQCGTPEPAVVQYGLFALANDQVAAFQASGWTADGSTPADFVWQCASCKHEWPVG